MSVGASVVAAVGTIVSGEMDITWTPRGGCHGRRPVLLFHGQLRTAQDWNDPTNWPGSTGLAWALAKSGLVVIAAYWSGPNWGNAAFRSEVTTALTYAGTLGAATDKALVLGASMGAFDALSIASHSPGSVAAGIGVIPAVNLGNARDNNLASAQSYINTAYGLTAGSTSATVALPADADVYVEANASQIAAPFRLYGSSGDTTVGWTDPVNLAQRRGWYYADVNATGGHTDTTIASVPVSEVVQHLYSHA